MCTIIFRELMFFERVFLAFCCKFPHVDNPLAKGINLKFLWSVINIIIVCAECF